MKIISFSLWGVDEKYTLGAIKNAELAKTIYSDWICRFYIGTSTPIEIINKLKSFDNTEVIVMDEVGDWNGMFWRFYAASDDNVRVMLSRDCDSRLNLREKAAVDEWLASDKSFHIMRDHPWHGTQILGGMWGFKNNNKINFKELINNYKKGGFYQVDQNFLREIIYPVVVNDSMIHDEFFNYNINKKPFPAKRNGQEFVGEAFDKNDNYNKEHRNLIK